MRNDEFTRPPYMKTETLVRRSLQYAKLVPC
jgi:hypothetical protein